MERDLIEDIRNALSLMMSEEFRNDLAKAMKLPPSFLDPKHLFEDTQAVLDELNKYLGDKK